MARTKNRGGRQGSVPATAPEQGARRGGRQRSQPLSRATSEEPATIHVQSNRNEDQSRLSAIAEIASASNAIEADLIDGGLQALADVEDLRGLSSEDLKTLGQDASIVLDVLAPADLMEGKIVKLSNDLATPGNRVYRLLENFVESLNPFTGGYTTFIRPNSVAQALSIPAGGEASVEDIVHLANLAKLMTELLNATLEDRHNILQMLDMDFPRSFVSSPSRSVAERGIKSSDLMFGAALSIRTQLAISLLQPGSTDPEILLLDVFSNPDKSLRSWDFSTLNPQMVETIETRINRIREFIDPSIENVDLKSLEDEFGWNQFLWEISQWVHARGTEIHAQVEAGGGIDSIMTRLEDTLLRPSAVKRMITAQRPTDFVGHATNAVPGRFSLLGTLKKQFGGAFPTLSPTARGNAVQHSTAPTAEMMQQIDGGGALFRRQEGATRIEFDTQDAEGEVSSAPQVTQDAGFQRQMSNPQNTEARRKAAAALRPGGSTPRKRATAGGQSAPKRRRPTQPAADGDAGYVPIDDVANEELGNHEEHNQDEAAPSSPPSSRYLEANAGAKLATARAVRQRAPQVRTPWNTRETDALVYYIGKYGGSWSYIKSQADPATFKSLEARSEVNLKDKASNMAFDYYKSGVPLPPGFENVPLKTRQVNDLRDKYGVEVEGSNRPGRRSFRGVPGPEAEPEPEQGDTVMSVVLEQRHE